MTADEHKRGPALDPLDRPMTFKDAAAALGVPYHVVQRAARRGLVQTYRLGSPRRYVALRAFRVTRDEERRWGKVCECLFVKKMCVIPPTVHPDTGQPYRWIGMPLHEIDFRLLPLVEMEHG